MQEREVSQGSTFSLPLMLEGAELFRLEMGSKFKEEGSPSWERIVGQIKIGSE